MSTKRLCMVVLCMLLIGAGQAARASFAPPIAPEEWGERVVWEGYDTAYAVYRRSEAYAETAFLVTDMRDGPEYADVESQEARMLTIYRAYDGANFVEEQPVVFFIHGGAWTDGYAAWYDFVARAFTGEKGWVTVVVDYRLTSDQVFIADEHCPDRATCAQPANVAARTKAAWYPDNAQDVAEAFDWVANNIADASGDPSKLFVFGHSAGGHLAALLATHPAYAGLRSHVRGLIGMSGAYDLNDLSVPTFGADLAQTFDPGETGWEATLAEASPASYIAPGLRMPPVFLLHAQQELPTLNDQTLAFKALLEECGQRVDYAYLTGYTHSTEMEAIGDPAAAPTAQIIAYIEALLAEPYRAYLPVATR